MTTGAAEREGRTPAPKIGMPATGSAALVQRQPGHPGQPVPAPQPDTQRWRGRPDRVPRSPRRSPAAAAPPRLLHLVLAALLAAPAAVIAASSGNSAAAAGASQASQAAGPVTLPIDPTRPVSADGLRYPLVPRDPAQLAALLAAVEQALRDPATPAAALPALGHQQQVIYRVLGHQRALAAQVRARLPQRWRRGFDRQVAARREFIALQARGQRPRNLPAWRIIQPEPAANLLRYYREAAAATGITWQVLAAVNLVESGMGRIDGVSVADARGPMQFLPSTWAEAGIGQGGDIRDPRTAIHAAARYLVRRGGLRDIRKALWGYNNSVEYGRAVLEYAALLREDPAAFTGLYHWQIHYAAAGGDLWLPVGTSLPRPLPVASFLRRSPLSQPPPGSSGY